MVDVAKYSIFKNLKIDKSTISFKENIGEWCKLPYPDHPNGCPNYGKNLYCPPDNPFYKEEVLKYSIHILFYTHFNINAYKSELSIKNKDWSDRKLSCCLYWQKSLKNKLFQKVLPYYDKNVDLLLGCGSGFGNIYYSMESVGINVFKTLKDNNINIERNPKNFVILCSLLCTNIDKKINLNEIKNEKLF